MAPPVPPVVLCYHAISTSWSSPLSVTPGKLGAQVRFLLRRGYEARTLARAMDEPARGKAFVITFDDAYRSVREQALPVLAELGVPASLFVATEIVDRRGLMTEMIPIPKAWVGPTEDMRAMSWDEVRSLAAAGWEVGSHTCSHPFLTEVDGERLRLELERSKEICESQLQAPCISFAYPFGAYDDLAMEAVGRAGYRQAVTLEQHVLDPLHGRGRLDVPREGIYPSTTWPKFLLNTSRPIRRLRCSAPFSVAARRLWPPDASTRAAGGDRRPPASP
jgi:peptidoglycan/xylan/chitin deacetylase (PgdA/CDA1 family)